MPARLWIAVAFGHVLTLIGWLWIALALGAALDRSDVAWHHPLAKHATATVDSVETKSASGRTNAPYAEIHYHFADESGRSYQGTAEDLKNEPPPVGGEVEVEYEARDPAFSKLAAYASPLYTVDYLLIVLGLVVPGLAVVIGMAIRAHRQLRALRVGEQVAATIAEKVTNSAGRDAMTYVTFEYAIGDARHRRKVQVDNPDRFTVGSSEPVLVDPARPRAAVLLADLPARDAWPPVQAIAGVALVGFVAYKLGKLLWLAI